VDTDHEGDVTEILEHLGPRHRRVERHDVLPLPGRREGIELYLRGKISAMTFFHCQVSRYA
jgi:ArsR family metal-binding transcriptional regulator